MISILTDNHPGSHTPAEHGSPGCFSGVNHDIFSIIPRIGTFRSGVVNIEAALRASLSGFFQTDHSFSLI